VTVALSLDDMRSVILTLDGAAPDRALPIARQVAQRYSASVVVVHIGDGRDEVESLVAGLRADGIAAELETHPQAAAGAAQIVADAARRREGGLIIVATGRPPQAQDVASPSLTRRLLGAAPCPVVAVPAAA
jgi:nucleotide-binding universal stress UspA family protein